MAVFLVGHTASSLASDNGIRGLLLGCSNIEVDAERLNCVDKLILSIAGQSSVESVESQSAQELVTQRSPSYDLIAAYKDNDERWIFEFDNGEVWQQTEPRYLPTLENLPVRVTISEGVFGSHDLRAENYGRPVKIKRLN